MPTARCMPSNAAQRATPRPDSGHPAPARHRRRRLVPDVCCQPQRPGIRSPPRGTRRVLVPHRAVSVARDPQQRYMRRIVLSRSSSSVIRSKRVSRPTIGSERDRSPPRSRPGRLPTARARRDWRPTPRRVPVAHPARVARRRRQTACRPGTSASKRERLVHDATSGREYVARARQTNAFRERRQRRQLPSIRTPRRRTSRPRQPCPRPVHAGPVAPGRAGSARSADVRRRAPAPDAPGSQRPR